MIDISNLSPDDRVHKLLIYFVTKKSTKLYYWDDEEQISEEEAYKIFNVLKHRVYFISSDANFLIDDKQYTVTNYQVDSCQLIESLLNHNPYCHIIFFDLIKTNGIYTLRMFLKEDTSLKREYNINKLLK